jgi:hypothetical protein
MGEMDENKALTIKQYVDALIGKINTLEREIERLQKKIMEYEKK